MASIRLDERLRWLCFCSIIRTRLKEALDHLAICPWRRGNRSKCGRSLLTDRFGGPLVPLLVGLRLARVIYG